MRTIAALLCWLALASAALAQQSVFVPATTASTPIAVAAATTTLLVTGVAGKRIYPTAMILVVDGASNVQLIAGTGATCGTGTVNVTGVMDFPIGTVLQMGTGNGAFAVAPPGLSLCMVTTGAVGHDGVLAYAIF